MDFEDLTALRAALILLGERDAEFWDLLDLATGDRVRFLEWGGGSWLVGSDSEVAAAAARLRELAAPPLRVVRKVVVGVDPGPPSIIERVQFHVVRRSDGPWRGRRVGLSLTEWSPPPRRGRVRYAPTSLPVEDWSDVCPAPDLRGTGDAEGLVALERSPPLGYVALLKRCGSRAVKQKGQYLNRSRIFVEDWAAALIDGVTAQPPLSLDELQEAVELVMRGGYQTLLLSAVALSDHPLDRATLSRVLGVR